MSKPLVRLHEMQEPSNAPTNSIILSSKIVGSSKIVARMWVLQGPWLQVCGSSKIVGSSKMVVSMWILQDGGSSNMVASPRWLRVCGKPCPRQRIYCNLSFFYRPLDLPPGFICVIADPSPCIVANPLGRIFL
jgi:hypothetical protein